MYVLLKMNAVAYCCQVQGCPTVPRFAVTGSNDVCLWTVTDRGVRQPNCHDCQISISKSSEEAMSGDVCLKKLPGILHENDANNQVMLRSKNNYSHFNDSENADCALFKLIEHTNLDINKAVCLHMVHILQHPTSCPTTKSTQTTMVNTLKMNLSPLPAGKYGKSTEHSTQQCHQANAVEGAWEAETVRALGALRRLLSKSKLVVEKCREMHFLSN